MNKVNFSPIIQNDNEKGIPQLNNNNYNNNNNDSNNDMTNKNIFPQNKNIGENNMMNTNRDATFSLVNDNQQKNLLTHSTFDGTNNNNNIDNNNSFIFLCKEEISMEINRHKDDKSIFTDRDILENFDRFFMNFSMRAKLTKFEENKDLNNEDYILGADICRELKFSSLYSGIVFGIFIPKQNLQNNINICSHLFAPTKIIRNNMRFVCLGKLKATDKGTFIEESYSKNNENEQKKDTVCISISEHIKNCVKHSGWESLFDKKQKEPEKAIYLYKNEENLNKIFLNKDKTNIRENITTPIKTETFTDKEKEILDQNDKNNFDVLPIKEWVDKSRKIREKMLLKNGVKYFTTVFLFSYYGEKTECWRYIKTILARDGLKIFPDQTRQTKLSKTAFFISIEAAIFFRHIGLINFNSEIFSLISNTHKQRYLFTGELFLLLLLHKMYKEFLEIMKENSLNNSSKFKTEDAKIRLNLAFDDYLSSFDVKRRDDECLLYLFKYSRNSDKLEKLKDFVRKNNENALVVSRIINKFDQDDKFFQQKDHSIIENLRVFLNELNANNSFSKQNINFSSEDEQQNEKYLDSLLQGETPPENNTYAKYFNYHNSEKNLLQQQIQKNPSNDVSSKKINLPNKTENKNITKPKDPIYPKEKNSPTKLNQIEKNNLLDINPSLNHTHPFRIHPEPTHINHLSINDPSLTDTHPFPNNVFHNHNDFIDLRNIVQTKPIHSIPSKRKLSPQEETENRNVFQNQTKKNFLNKYRDSPKKNKHLGLFDNVADDVTNDMENRKYESHKIENNKNYILDTQKNMLNQEQNFGCDGSNRNVIHSPKRNNNNNNNNRNHKLIHFDNNNKKRKENGKKKIPHSENNFIKKTSNLRSYVFLNQNESQQEEKNLFARPIELMLNENNNKCVLTFTDDEMQRMICDGFFGGWILPTELSKALAFEMRIKENNLK